MGGLAKEFGAAATVVTMVAKKQKRYMTDNGGVGSGGSNTKHTMIKTNEQILRNYNCCHDNY
eukprot:7553926-Ditylum_brightwellii.AAC.1